VDHPGPVIALYVAVLALGFLALWRLVPTRMMPYVESPMLAVITQVPSMPPEEVEGTVTTPVEQRLASVSDVRYIRSRSMPGMSVVTLEFPYRYDMRQAMQGVQGALASLDLGLDSRDDVPPRVIPYDPLNTPVLRLALRAPTWDPLQLRAFADTTIVRRLGALPGVESVYALGGPRGGARIVVDRDRLAHFGLSIEDVRRAVDGGEAALGVGSVPSAGGHAAVVVSAPRDLDGRVVAEVRGRPVRLRDVADVEISGLEPVRKPRVTGGRMALMSHADALYRLNGQYAIEINVIQRPDASSPATIAAVRREVDALRREHPGLGFDEAYDNAHFVEVMKRNLFEDLGLAVVLTGLVVYLFLGDVRGTLVALVTIPASLACAVILFVPLGLSLNSSSLIGLLLAVGRLVDDAIVDLDAVQRHLRMGKSARDAAVDGCSEVRRAVVGATVVICLAMVPLTFSGGLTQDMFEGIVWPFLLALAASLGVALTLTPLLASWVWRGVRPSPRPRLAVLADRYGTLLGLALRHRRLVICCALCVCYVAAMLYPLIGSEMMPLADTGQAYAVMEAKPGTSLVDTSRMAAKLEAILRAHPEVERVSTEIGTEMDTTAYTGYGAASASTATMMITLSDKDVRSASVWDVCDGVWSEATRAIPDIRRLSIKEMGSDVMATSMAPIEILIHGPELSRLDALAKSTKRLAERSGSLVEAGTAWALDAPQWRVEVDSERAAVLGLTPREVARQARCALQGCQTRSRLHGKSLTIRYRGMQRQDIADVGAIDIAGRGGRHVPLRALATFHRELGPSMIMHDGLRRVNSVTAYYRKDGPGSMQLTMDLLMDSVMNVPYPPGYGAEQRGDMVQMMDAFGRLLQGIALALVLIYLALAVQFGSGGAVRALLLPLTLMAAVPLELAGVFAGLVIAHQTFSTVSLLGLVVLNGMDVTAAILLLDRMVAASSPRERDAAIVEAGKTRLTPILMTVLVTLVVMAPVAFFPRTGVDAYAPLATVIVGGLLMATPLTLLVVPVLYAVVDDRFPAATVVKGVDPPHPCP
jgi:HAE1 family hydrophobic/amphiphilic exporter-1